MTEIIVFSVVCWCVVFVLLGGVVPVRFLARGWRRPSPNRRVEWPWPKLTLMNTQISPLNTGYETLHICSQHFNTHHSFMCWRIAVCYINSAVINIRRSYWHLHRDVCFWAVTLLDADQFTSTTWCEFNNKLFNGQMAGIVMVDVRSL